MWVTLFVYGSLLSPAVLRSLLDRMPASQPARLSGYRRAALRGQVFPGAVPAPGAATPGALIALRPRELRWLDAWEDDFFVRRAVRVDLPGGTRICTQAYLLAPRYRHLAAARDWAARDFARRLAPACAERARRWRRDRKPGLRHTWRIRRLSNDKVFGKQPGHA